jgi:hypothetical protein
LGLQLYTASAAEKDQKLYKMHAETDQIIIDYVKELEKCGYKIINFPGPDKFRNYYISDCIVIPPPPPSIKK